MGMRKLLFPLRGKAFPCGHRELFSERGRSKCVSKTMDDSCRCANEVVCPTLLSMFGTLGAGSTTLRVRFIAVQ